MRPVVLALALAAAGTASCALREDGSRQCEQTIGARYASPSFYKRLPTEITNINVAHPDVDGDYTQRWIDLNYETREGDADPVAHRHHCVFQLDDGRLGRLLGHEDREPRLLNYGR